MCFALDKPCIGISTLEALAYNVSLHRGLICAVMAARLDLVYCAVFRSDGKNIKRLSEDKLLPIAELQLGLEAAGEYVVTVGDAAEKLGGERFLTAPPHLKLQLASSLCTAGFTKEPYSPDKLEAAYMEITKAEKDLKK